MIWCGAVSDLKGLIILHATITEWGMFQSRLNSFSIKPTIGTVSNGFMSRDNGPISKSRSIPILAAIDTRSRVNRPRQQHWTCALSLTKRTIACHLGLHAKMITCSDMTSFIGLTEWNVGVHDLEFERFLDVPPIMHH